MKSYPLIRVRWSNEHIMAALFIVLLLYMLPVWVVNPSEVLSFLAVLVLALAIDAAAGFFRYKRPVCSVSAAVTAGILQILTPGIPLWGRLAAVTAALLLGKHIWGGTGKNVINPALTGILLLGFVLNFGTPFSGPVLLYIPALLLSLPFLLFRPFAGVGLMAGILLSVLAGSGQQLWPVIVGCVFLGCIVATDPTTVTHKPVEGFIGAFAAGYIPTVLTGSLFYLIVGILIFNLISYIIDLRIRNPKEPTYRNLFKIRKAAEQSAIDGSLLDLTGDGEGKAEKSSIPEPAEILKRIEKHGVYGMGGAGYPTASKIRTLIGAKTDERYLVINAAECDPGLIHDKWLLKNRLYEIESGIEALNSIIGFKKIILAAKDISGISIKDPVTAVKVDDLYPIGAERILIEKLLGKSLKEGAIPAAEGILVLNVQTALAIYDAAYLDKDADTRYITVSDLKNIKSTVARVHLGNRIHEVLEKAYPGNILAFAGGGIMQAHMASDEDVVDKTVNYIAAANVPKYKESPQCSRCGLCRSSCPAGLESGRIAELVDAGRLSDTLQYTPARCLGCGTCSYVCLAGKDLSSRVREAKKHSEA